MLGLNVDFDVDIKTVKMPISFVGRNECVHCGGKGTLEFIDKFGNKSKKEINAFDHIKCSKCGRLYSIRWSKEDNSYDMVPSAVNPSITRDLSNLFNINSIKRAGNKNLE